MRRLVLLAALVLTGLFMLAGPRGAFAQDPGSAEVQRVIADYRLGSGDKVRVTVFGEDTLTGEYLVGGSGKISLPLIGEVQAGGLTISQFQEEVATSLKQGYLNDPKVSAEVLNYRPYYILGEVQKPGEYPYSNGLTVLNAVATANGFTYRANTKKVFIKRAGEQAEHEYPLTSITSVAPGDTIRIAERFFDAFLGRAARGTMAAMISSALRSLFKGGKFVEIPAVPEGVVAYAIGDVHGRDDLLEPLIAHILANPGFGAAERRVVIGLGDYIDRGPASRQVIERLIALKARGDVEAHYMRGNHDQTLLDFLADAGAGPAWCEFGGAEAMRSYGVNPPSGRAALDDWDTARQALAEAMPESHLHLLRGLEPSFDLGSYFFAHAGARPGVPLGQQDEQDLMWIRQPFLGDTRPFERVVVHGHSASVEAFADRRRIGIDTGAYATGVLTALRLEGEDRRLVQAAQQRDKSVRIEQTQL